MDKPLEEDQTPIDIIAGLLSGGTGGLVRVGIRVTVVRILARQAAQDAVETAAREAAEVAAREAADAAAKEAAKQAATAARNLLIKRAGFSGKGEKIILDENLPRVWAEQLREAGYDARSVAEMQLKGRTDPQINQIADQVGARVLSYDRGHDIAGGFEKNAIVVSQRVRSIDSVLRLIGARR